MRVPPCDYSLDICLVSVLALCPSRVRVYFGMAFGQIPYCLSIDFAMNRSLSSYTLRPNDRIVSNKIV